MIASLVAVAALSALGLALPAESAPGAAAWMVVLLAAFAGWGSVVARVARVAAPDLGLRIAWGIAGVLAVTGVLVAFRVCSRPVLLAIVAVGLAAFVGSARAASERSLAAAVGRLRVRGRAIETAAWVIVGALILLHVTGAVCALERNPWDDDLAYTPLIRRLLDIGDLIEPFSFRRLSAYGGQTVLGALAASRGDLIHVHAMDRGLCFIVVVLLVTGLARERGTSPALTTVIAAVLALVPDNSINTASYWSGAALFLATYRTALHARWGLVALVVAASCTLRQNYLSVNAVFLVGIALAEIVRRRRVGEPIGVAVRAWLAPAAIVVAALAPWAYASFDACRTFLYPVIEGTWRRGLSLRPDVMSLADSAGHAAWTLIETAPFVVAPAVVAVLVVARDRRPGAPLTVLFVSSVLGVLALIVGFAGTEPFHLWRYAFAFSLATLLAAACEVGARDERVEIPAIGRWILGAALVMQYALQPSAAIERVRATLHAIRSHDVDTTAAAPYQALQRAAPAGAPIAVMLDAPAHLDFDRNPIANLDTPGFASPDGRMPAFRGAEALRRYLVAHGYPLLAFVRSETSSHFFRRPFWVWRIFHDGDLFTSMSVHAIDMIESFSVLATACRVLHDQDGLVLLDLGACTTVGPIDDDPRRESVRRAAWMRALVEREGLQASWDLTSRDDVRFESGVSSLTYWHGHRFVRARSREAMQGRPMRALARRVHVRVRGEGAMLLTLDIELQKPVAFAPVLHVSLDGVPLLHVSPDGDRYRLALRFEPGQLDGSWQDLDLVFAGAGVTERDARPLRIAHLVGFGWRPAP